MPSLGKIAWIDLTNGDDSMDRINFSHSCRYFVPTIKRAGYVPITIIGAFGDAYSSQSLLCIGQRMLDAFNSHLELDVQTGRQTMAGLENLELYDVSYLLESIGRKPL